MKVLVFGFSVTGDTPGFVEFWKRDYSAASPHLHLNKMAIGGIQPGMGRYLIPKILDQLKPNAVVFELATPVYRLRPPSDWILNDHRNTVNFIVRLCRKKNITCGFLDLPQEKIDHSIDWMPGIHSSILKKCGIPIESVELQPDTLRDNVHPNDEGRKIYANALDKLLRKIQSSKRRKYNLATSEFFYDALHISELEIQGAGNIVEFERNGFKTQVLQLNSKETATLKLPRPMQVVGALISMGPRTGYMDIRMNGTGEIINCFDPHCYYQRMGGRLISHKKTDAVTVVQGQKVPETELLKGAKSFEPRVGGISHIFVDRSWDDNGAAV